MELRQLEYFVAVAEAGNFTRAAATVHVAQPGVSAQIRRLERELGQDLLDRSGRSVRLTEAGAAVLPYARSALAAVAGARQAVDELTGLLRGHVTIGTVTSISSAQVDLPALLASFHHEHPGVDVTLSVGNSDDLIDALRAGRLDLAVIGPGPTSPAGIDSRVLASEPLVAVVSRHDPLAARTSITVSALADRTLISLPPGTGLRSVLDHACASAGFAPRIAFEAGDPRMLARLAAHGLGVAIVPRSAADASAGPLHVLAITEPELSGRIALAWRAGGPISPPARKLITQVGATAAQVS
ncbi:MAG TPA: LysR family transcriptional regulator [Streptosporangiaceae bacterium]|jgi:DNA-binding transcriptional LysR family regulator